LNGAFNANLPRFGPIFLLSRLTVAEIPGGDRRKLSHALTGFARGSGILAHMTDSVGRLYDAVIAARGADPEKSRTARLLRAGRAKMAKKLAEEAVEVVIDAMHGQPEAVVMESADLIYNLVVLWVHAGVRPEEVWAEMRRRELMFGIAEKVPKDLVRAASRRKVVPLESRRVRKRR
jgi:phosphoribosyl-ATP pyrophosphohydrolase